MKSLAKVLALSIALIALTVSLAAQQPPLIDRELLFGDPEISGAQISPDGKYIAFMKPLKQDPQHLGEKDGGAFQRRPAHYAGHQAPHPCLFLEP